MIREELVCMIQCHELTAHYCIHINRLRDHVLSTRDEARSYYKRTLIVPLLETGVYGERKGGKTNTERK